MKPQSGGRLDVRLSSHDGSGARYAVELSTAAGTWTSELSVSLGDGEVTGQSWSGGGEPPEWLCRYLRSALRSAWRSQAEDGWPRRMTRWREEPDPRRSSSGESP